MKARRGIPNPQSPILNPQSPILNPQSTLLSYLVVVCVATSAPGQTLVQENGRALDAPGSANSTVFSSQSSTRAMLNLFSPGSPDTSLPTLEAAIDATNIFFIPTLNPTGSATASFGPPGNVIEPFGISRFGPSSALPNPGIDVVPLSAARPALVQPTLQPRATFSTADSSAFNLNLSIPRILSPTTLPTFSTSRTSTISRPSLGTAFSFPGRSGGLPIIPTYYEEEILGSGSLFSRSNVGGPTPTLLGAGTGNWKPTDSNPWVSAGVHEMTWPARVSTRSSRPGDLAQSTEPLSEQRAKAARELQQYIMRAPEPPSSGIPIRGFGAPTWPTDALLDTVYGAPWRVPVIENSLMEEALRQAQRAVKPRLDGTGSGGGSPERAASVRERLDEFTLTPGPAAQAQRPGAFDGERVYAQLKRTVETLKRIEFERQRTGTAGGEFGLGLSESYARVRDYVRGNAEVPLSSMVGGAVSPSAQFAHQAEQFLKSGAYHRALAHYDVALVADRDNPLLVLGQAHALIGAGEYFGAFRKLLLAIERFPEIAYFKLDLNEFITDADLLDIRRADLEKRLAHQDDYRFRFLLGYIEHYTGLTEFGLGNIERAAAAAPAGSPITEFLETIRAGNRMREQMKP
ncbi:MAG: hypothetical protein V3W34_09595 [Phycisphaerae bacterium]